MIIFFVIILPIIALYFFAFRERNINFRSNLKQQLKKSGAFTKGNAANLRSRILGAIVRFKRKRIGILQPSLAEKRNNQFERLRKMSKIKPSDFLTYEEDMAINNCWTVFFVVLAGLGYYMFNVNIAYVGLGLLLVLFYIYKLKYDIIDMDIYQSNIIIEREFEEFYGQLYYIVQENKKNPLEFGFNFYKNLCKTPEMLNFVESGLLYINSYSEEFAVDKLETLYRDIDIVAKFMRLEKQSIKGGNIEKELYGLYEQIKVKQELYIEDFFAKLQLHSSILIRLVFVLIFEAILFAGVVVIQYA